MAFTLDHVLELLRRTVLHPVLSLALPGALTLSKLDVFPVRFAEGIRSFEWTGITSTRLKLAFCCVGFSWLLEINRVMGRRALNPAPEDRYDWPNEVVVITGGSGGIGARLVQKLERLGATIAVLDVIPLTFTPGPKTTYFTCDVGSFEKIQAVSQEITAKCGAPTVLVANAGIVRGRTILEASDNDLRKTFDVNVLGVLWCLKTFLPAMIAADHGHILVTSSSTAFATIGNATDYSASKAAVTSIIEGLQTELKHHYGNPKVRASAIFPGTITTKMFEGVDQSSNGFMVPLLQPEQVADRMLKILINGRSELAFLPATSNIVPWMRCLPVWMRVNTQDASAHAMDHLAVKKR